MKKSYIIIGVVLLLVFIGYRFFVGTYNDLVQLDENVNAKWAQVENQYQRRMDLIPNLVNTVKGFAQQEKDVFIGVTEARSKASSIQIDPSNMSAAQLQQFQQAQGQLSSALSRLLVTVEKYPDIKSNQNFLELQAQLEGTENRIAVERGRFNEATQIYNSKVRTFPTTVLAGMYGFEKRPMFEAEAGAEKAPQVEF